MEILKIHLKEKLLIKYYNNIAFNIGKTPNYGGYQRGLGSMVYKFSDKKTAAISCSVKSEIIPIHELAEELHKPIIRKFEKRKVH